MTSTTCPICGTDRVSRVNGVLVDVQEYENGARYRRGPHSPTCERIMASRESWAQQELALAAAKAECAAIRAASKAGAR